MLFYSRIKLLKGFKNNIKKKLQLKEINTKYTKSPKMVKKKMMR